MKATTNTRKHAISTTRMQLESTRAKIESFMRDRIYGIPLRLRRLKRIVTISLRRSNTIVKFAISPKYLSPRASEIAMVNNVKFLELSNDRECRLVLRKSVPLSLSLSLSLSYPE